MLSASLAPSTLSQLFDFSAEIMLDDCVSAFRSFEVDGVRDRGRLEWEVGKLGMSVW